MPITKERVQELLDYDPLTGHFRWKISRGGWSAGRIAGTVCWDGYRRIGIDGEQFHAQKLAWLIGYGYMPEMIVDHANLDKDDNRLDNLRLANHSLNAANQAIRSCNTSGFKGASRIRSNGKWFSSIKIMGKSKYLGTFDTAEAAHAAYMRAAVGAYGEFARAS